MKLQKRILINLIPGLLPIFVFVLADEIWGTDTGLLIAVIFSIISLFFTWYRTGRFEKFILLDVSLIVALGTISMWLNNDVFFKLKPAFVEMILAAIIGLSSFGRKNIVLEMSKRYLRDVQITKTAEFRMGTTLKIFFWLTLVHIGLVIWSAFMLPEKAWAFISGVLYYLMIAGYFLIEAGRNYLINRRYRYSEILPVVNEAGQVTGRAPREMFHFNKTKKMLHPVVHLHLFNSKGELFLQHRPSFKKVQPDKWDTAVGGHIAYGETIAEALARETFEEIGITGNRPVFLERYIWETDVERELVYMFLLMTDVLPEINARELSGGKFWNPDEIRASAGSGIFTPNFLHEFEWLGRNAKLG